MLLTDTSGADFTLVNYLFRAVKLTKKVYFDKYKQSGYGIGFDTPRSFSLSTGSGFAESVIILVADMGSSLHIDNKKKDILILDRNQTDELDNTTSTAEKEYYVSFTEKHKKFNFKSAL